MTIHATGLRGVSPVTSTVDREFLEASQRALTRAAADLAGFCEHVEHNEPNSVESAASAGDRLRQIASQLSVRGGISLVAKYAARIRAVEEKSLATGLAADVRHYGEWMRERAMTRIGHLYPSVKLPDEHGGEATVIAWLWARTAQCPNPACGAAMPLLNSFALSRRKNREAWLEPVTDRGSREIAFRIKLGPGCPPGGSVARGGATCLACGTAAPLKEVRAFGKANGLGSQLVCIVAEGHRRRIYLPAQDDHLQTSLIEPPVDPPSGELPYNPRAITVPNYGATQWADLFTARQLTTMCTFADLVAEAREKVLADGGDEPYADAITHYLSLVIGRLANRSSNLCFWNPGRDTIEQVFAPQRPTDGLGLCRGQPVLQFIRELPRPARIPGGDT